MRGHSLLWQIQKDANFKGYLFGTIHLYIDAIKPLFLGVKPYLRQCDAFFAEVNFGDLEVVDLARYFTLPENHRKEDFIKSPQWSKMSAICRKHFGIDLQSMEKNYPLFILHQLQLSLLPAPNLQSMDTLLWDQAKEWNLACGGLEEIEQHFSILEKIPLTYQYKSLMAALRNVRKFKRAHAKLLQLYLHQDIRTIYHWSRKFLGPCRRIMLLDRNFIIFQSILRNIENRKCFFAFGAGHFYGNEGVIAYLKKHGYKVKPVPMQHPC